MEGKTTALGAFAARQKAHEGSVGSAVDMDARGGLSLLAAFAAVRVVPTQPTSSKPGSLAPLAATDTVKAGSSRAPSATSDAKGKSAVSAALVESEGSKVGFTKEETGTASGRPTSGAAERSTDSTSADLAPPSGSEGAGRDGQATKRERHDSNEQTHDDEADLEELDFLDDSSDDENDNEHKSDASATELHQGSVDAVDETDDLYECGSNKVGDSSQVPQQSQPKVTSIRLPKASEIELFHSVLVRDTDRLEVILQERSPSEVLDIRDSDQRTLYHYGALCPEHGIQRAVFGHVDSYNERRLANQIGKIMEEKGVVDQWLSKCDIGKRDWEPPCVKELTHKFIKMKQRDWEMICSCVDRDNRSILHYAAAAPGHATFEHDTHFSEVIRTKRELIHARDIDAKLPLHFAVEVGNIHVIKWYFNLGIHLNQEDVSCLLHLNHQRLVQNVLVQQLERLDTRAYHARRQDGLGHDGECGWDLGLGILARVEVERVQGSTPDGHAASLLLDAARYGNMNAVELLLRQGTSPRVCDSNGWTALHVCADEGTKSHVEIAQMLLNPPHSLPVDSKSLKGRTPLHLAVKLRQLETNSRSDSSCGEMVRTLFEYGASADARDRKGSTALHLACRFNNVSVAASLITSGCNVAAVDNNGQNCLHLAALQGSIETINYLISWEEGAGYLSNAGDNRGRKPIEVARNEQTRQLLIMNTKKQNQWSFCYRGNVEGVKLLLVRSRKTTDAASAQSFVSDQTVQTMRAPLHLVAQGYFDLLQPSDSSKHKRSLRPATRQGDLSHGRYLKIASLLLRAGADPCAADKWGITPIMIAAAVDNEQLLEILLESCLSSRRLQDTDQDGNTALHYSYAFCNAKNSSILEDAMDGDEPTNNLGKTPLGMTGYRKRIFPEGYLAYQRDMQQYAAQHT